MQIQVRCGCGEAACPEWAVVEVQGVLQPQPCFSGRIQGLHIGRLCSTSSAPTSKGGYTFTVGYHELAGSKVTLKKPLLVLRKKKNDNGDTGELDHPAQDSLQGPPQGSHLKAGAQGEEGPAGSGDPINRASR
uniref:Uncharacterized protein n=1 Tax=Aegilops tauschii subsp. strangulata TaxID=200361 RepID=A0A453KKW3_AEGTS